MNKLIWKEIGDSGLGKLYNSDDIDPIAIYLGRMLNEIESEHDDELYTRKYQDQACEVYDLAHRVPEWLKDSKPLLHGNHEFDLGYFFKDDWDADTEQVVTTEQASQWLRNQPEAIEDSQEYRWNDDE